MQFYESIRGSYQNIISHILRSILTLLGICIGVFAVVTMFSSIYGIKNLINDKMEGMGWDNSIIIYPSSGGSSQPKGRGHRRFKYIKREAKPLTFSDYEMIKSKIQSKYIYGMVEVYNKLYINKKEYRINLRATNLDFFKSKTYPLLSGRYFNTFEDDNAQKVCVIGYYFANNYFKNENPLGKVITIGTNRFKIIGILNKDELNSNGMNFNPWERKRDLKAVYIPLSTGSLYLRSQKSVDYIYLQSKDNNSYSSMKTETYQLLLAKHKMAHDFAFNDVGALMFKITEEINGFMKKWNITLSAIASISLIVGGIGLFSTLLISISERMMEIGIRKSIGAKESDIFLLFIFESVMLALIGALFGIIISTFLVKLFGMLLKTSFPVPIQGILLGLGFASIIGILSGLYPAIKASKINPIKAIYYFE